MTAAQQMKSMLDQLMGTRRDGENKTGVQFNSSKVCRSFLLDCCPHEILSATRMDLGKCSRIHDVALRADFLLASKSKDYFYDIDATEHLERFIAECDRTTEQAKVRLLETQEELSAEVSEKISRINELSDKIGEKLVKAEEKGAEGLVAESMTLMEEVEELRRAKSDAEQDYRNSMPSSSFQQQKLRVCEVCSAYLGIHDNDQRLAEHFGGKLHLGFIEIREKLAELQSKVEERRVQRRHVYSKQRERERERRGSGSRERERRSSSGSRDSPPGGATSERRRHRDRRRDRRRHTSDGSSSSGGGGGGGAGVDGGGDRYRRDRSRSRDGGGGGRREWRGHERSRPESSRDYRQRDRYHWQSRGGGGGGGSGGGGGRGGWRGGSSFNSHPPYGRFDNERHPGRDYYRKNQSSSDHTF